MGTVIRTRLLMAAFCVSLCALGVTAGAQKLAQVAPVTTFIIDDGDPGFSSTHFMPSTSYITAFSRGYNDDTAYISNNHLNIGEAKATWSFTGLTDGTYRFYATWGRYPTQRTKQAWFTIPHSDEKIVIDQTQEPGTTEIGQRTWKDLGTATIANGEVAMVTLYPGEDSITMADAVLAKKVEGAPTHVCPTVFCPAPEPGCAYSPDKTLNSNGCSANPCGILQCEEPKESESLCGNGMHDAGESCDLGRPGQSTPIPSQPTRGCGPTCAIEKCGDGTTHEYLGEQCDDGNIVNGDGCSSVCKTEPNIFCGFEVAEGGTQCEEMTAVKCAKDGGEAFATNQACFEGMATYACNDGVDNDDDGNTDLDDKGCANAQDQNEGDGTTGLSLTLSAGTTSISAGENVFITASITNDGPDAATSPIDITIDIPAGMTFLPAESNTACVLRDGDVVCTSKINLETKTFGVTFTASTGEACAPRPIFNGRISSSPQGGVVQDESTVVVAVSCPQEPMVGTYITTPNLTGAPPPDFSAVHIKVGDTISFTHHTTVVGAASRQDLWEYDSAVLSCSSTGTDGLELTCTAVGIGLSNVNFQVTATMNDGTGRAIDSNVIGVNVTAQVATDACRIHELIARPWQNQTNPYDFNGTGDVNVQDYKDMLAYLKEYIKTARSVNIALPDANTTDPRKYPNADGSRNANGKETFTTKDLSALLQYIRCSQQQTPTQSVTLSSAALSCTDGGSVLTLQYDKNFDDPSVLLHATNQQRMHNGQFASRNGPVIIPLKELTYPAFPGSQVKLCHATNSAVCGTATVTGAECAPVVTLSSAVLSCKDNVTVLTLNYNKNFHYPAAHLLTSDLKPLHNGQHGSEDGSTEIPVTELLKPVAVGTQIKLCHGNNYGICGTTAVTGTACGAVQNACLNRPELKTAAALQNKPDPYDTNNNGTIENDDALQVINYLNTIGAGTPAADRTGPPFVDVNGDGMVSAIDSLLIINHMNAGCVAATPSTSLTIAVKNIGTTNTAVRNQKNVNLLRLEALAANQDVLLTKVVARAAAGSPLNAQNYTLWYDSNGDQTVDTKLQSGVPAQNNLVTFENLTGGGLLLAANTSKHLEIHADIASSTVNNTLQLELSTATPGYIAAERSANGADLVGIKTNGSCPAGVTCAITVTTVPSMLYTIGAQGNLYVTLDSTPVRPRQVLGGTLTDVLLRLELRAENEDVDVTKLRFVTVGGPANSIERLELSKDGAAAAFTVATTVHCSDFSVSTWEGNPSRTFCAMMPNKELVVPKGQSVDLLVRARMKNDAQGGLSGEPIQLAVALDGGGGGGGMTGGMGAQVANFQTFGFVEARGATSSANLAHNDGDTTAEGEVFIGTTAPGANQVIRGTKHVSVLSKITSIANANPDEDNTNVPTGVAPIGQFRFTAATNSNTMNGLNNVSFKRLKFAIVSTNVQIGDTYKIYNKADPSVKVTCRWAGAGGGTGGGGDPSPDTAHVSILCENLDASGGDFTVDSGESDVYVVEGTIINAQYNAGYASRLEVNFQGFSSPDTPANIDQHDQIVWLDKDAGTNARSFGWIEYGDTVVRSTNYGSPAGHGAASSTSSVAALTDNATCSPIPSHAISGVSNVTAGQQFQIGIGMHNTGKSTWVTGATAPYTLIVQDTASRSTWSVERAAYMANAANISVLPNQYMSFALWPAIAPATPGTYQLRVQMQKNGVPFGAVCTHNIVVKPAAPTVVLTGDNCPDVKTAKAQMPLFGSAGKFRQTSDGKFLLWAALEGGSSRHVKGVNFDTCETTLFASAELNANGIDEISVSDTGKILYKERTVVDSGNARTSKLYLIDKNTKVRTLVTDQAPSNGTGDRGLISRDGNSIVLTSWGANIDNDPNTAINNADGSREMFLIRNGVITQLTNFNGGLSTYKDSAGKFIPNQYTNMADAIFEDRAGRFISVNLDFNPSTGKRHERDILTSAPQPGDITLWEYRLYLYDTQTKVFHRISESKTVHNRAVFQSLINAKITEITGSAPVTQGFFRSLLSRLIGSALDMGNALLGSLLE